METAKATTATDTTTTTTSTTTTITTTPAPPTEPSNPSTTTQPVVGAKIRCYDSDWFSDDMIGSGGDRTSYTDNDGCGTVHDNQWWFENPDIYCTIENDPSQGGKCFQDTATAMALDWWGTVLDFGTVSLDYEERYCGNLLANSNGCGPAAIPDDLSATLTDATGFANQCAVHDSCYTDCATDRSICDTDFLDDMLKICARQTSCEALAHLFYHAVNTGGEAACVAARMGAGCSSGDSLFHCQQ